MAQKIQIRRGTASQLASLTLDAGELGYTTDTKRLYCGDGATDGGNPVGPGKIIQVANDTARLALTSAEVDNMDWVEVLAPVGAVQAFDVSFDLSDTQDNPQYAAFAGRYLPTGEVITPDASGVSDGTEGEQFPIYSNGSCILYCSSNYGSGNVQWRLAMKDPATATGLEWITDQDGGTAAYQITTSGDPTDPSQGGTQQMSSEGSAQGSPYITGVQIPGVRNIWGVVDNTNLSNNSGWALLGEFYLPPQNTSAPVMAQGTPWTVTNGSWDSTITSYNYQWQNSPDNATWSNIAGATSSTYAPQSTSANKYLRCIVTAINANGSTSANSNSIQFTAPTINAALVIGVPFATMADELTAGSWNNFPLSYAYQWQISTDDATWTNIGGATASTYTPLTGQIGEYLRLGVIATNNAGSSAQTFSPGQQIQAAPSVPTSGLLAYYKLNSSGADSVGSHALSATNTVSYAAGKINNAASFAASPASYLSNGSFVGSLSAFTITGWILIPSNADATAQSGVVFLGTAGEQTFIYDNTIYCDIFSRVIAPGTPLEDNTWAFFAITYDGTNIKISINNGTPASEAASGSFNFSSLDLGNWDSYNQAGLMIEEVGIWNRALSPTEIAELWNGGAGVDY
jgi:hypothetical protein